MESIRDAIRNAYNLACEMSEKQCPWLKDMMVQYGLVKDQDQEAGKCMVKFGLLLVFGIILCIHSFALFITIVCVAYPIAQTIGALDGGQVGETHWLLYWIVFAACSCFEAVLPFLGKNMWFLLFKGLFFSWCYLPQFEGAFILVGFLQKLGWIRSSSKLTTSAPPSPIPHQEEEPEKTENDESTKKKLL